MEEKTTNKVYPCEAQFKCKFQEIKDRIDSEEVVAFYDEWEFNFIIEPYDFEMCIASKITEVMLDKSIDEDTYITIGANDQFEIDLSVDRKSGEAWIYPVAYGKRMDQYSYKVL